MSVNNGYVNDNGRPASQNGWTPEQESKNAFTIADPNGSLPHTPKDVDTEVVTDEDLEQQKRDKEPLLYIKWITKRPGLAFGKIIV